MRTDSTHPQLAGVLGLLAEAGAAPDLDGFRGVVTRRLRELVPCELVGYNEISLAEGSATVTADPPGPRATRPHAFVRFMHEHPVIAAHRRGDLGAAAISDFLTESQWRGLDLYKRVFEPNGILDQLSVSLEFAEDRISAITLNRSSWGFTDHERTLLDLITPNLVQTRRQVIDRMAGERSLASAVEGVEALGTGLITLDSGDEPLTWSPIAARLVQEAFGTDIADGLPAEIAAWLDRERDQPGRRPLIFAAGEGRVSVARVEGERGEALLMREHRRAAAESLIGLGLTPRRAEVLAALMEGHTNEEIARRLELSPRTVQNHIAHIFDVLDVRTRTAAAARAREALS